MSIERYLLAVPKAELHVHLEGSIQPATLLKLAQRNGVELPAQSVEELQSWFQYRDFNHFIDIFVAATRCLRTGEDYELITYEFGANMARQNIRYAEVTFSPSTHRFLLNIPHDTYFGGLQRGRARAKADFGVEIRWNFDIVRNIEDSSRNQKLADYTTAVALEGKDDGVIALGLGGAEVGYPPERFAPWFQRRRAGGLHSAPHAGETVGPASVWGAVKALGAERVGHGVRASEDPALVAYLAEHHIPSRHARQVISPRRLSNTGGSSAARLYAAGVPLTVNSDDPPLFNTMLNNEVSLLATAFHFDLATIDEIVLNGARHSFLPQPEKQALEQTFRDEMYTFKANVIASSPARAAIT